MALLRAFKGLLKGFKGIFEDFLPNFYPEIKRKLSGKQVKKVPKPSLKLFPSTRKLQINRSEIHPTGHWKVTGWVEFCILMTIFSHLSEGFQGFRPQIRTQHAEISPGTNFEVIWMELKGFAKFCPVAFQWPAKCWPLDTGITKF